ncbi:MAG: MBL fold metallo-hydrolase [Promethearchaeota archaeon]
MGTILEEGKFNDNTYLFDANLFGLPRGLACYVVEGTEKKALIDVGGPNEAELLLKNLMESNLKPDILILTHAHWDHGAGIPYFQEKVPEIEVMASHLAKKALKDQAGFNSAFSNVITGLKPIEDAILLKEGDTVDLGDIKLTVYETPGHSNCSICLFDRESGVLFTGDTLGYRWTKDLTLAPIMPPEFSEEKLLASYEKIEKIEFSSIAMAHFGVITEDTALNFAKKAKSTYQYWRDFFLSTYKANSDKEYFMNKFSKKLQEYGIERSFADFTSKRDGGWILKALEMAGMI